MEDLVFNTTMFYCKQSYNFIQSILDDMDINACIQPYNYTVPTGSMSMYLECCVIEFFNEGDQIMFILGLSQEYRERLTKLPGGIIYDN